MRLFRTLLVAPSIGAFFSLAEAEVAFRIKGQGWSEFGRVMHATDTVEVNLNGNWLQSSGAQFTAVAAIGSNFEGAFGFGGYQVYHSLGNANQARAARYTFQNFVTESRMTWFQGDRGAPDFSLTFGNFSYSYNPDIKNLGAYLLRGPVYPGFLTSGFKESHVDSTKGNVLGARAHQAIGNFSHDLIIANERDLPPTFDWHVAYVAKYRAFNALDFGLGVNFYRALARDKDQTTPSGAEQSITHPYDVRYREAIVSKADTTDTTWVQYTHKGTKVVGMFSFDLKRLFGIESMGEQDLKLYGEAAILGVKDYGTVYNNIRERIPAMVGFNIPTWGLLDVMSLEVEYYGARYRNDLRKLGNFNNLPGINPVVSTSTSPSPVPVSYEDYKAQVSAWSGGLDSLGRLVNDSTIVIRGSALDIQNLTQDNLKWSLFMEKTLHKHVRFSGQVANDHFRPRPAASSINEVGGMAEAFSSPKDWYFMFRIGYLF